jgi:hypothetical protein
MVTLTDEVPVWLVGRASEDLSEDLNDGKHAKKRLLFDNDVISPAHAEIMMVDIRGHKRVGRTFHT